MSPTPVSSIKIAASGERTRALRRARVNSFFVRAMRWLLPVGAVLMLSSYGLFMQRTVSVETKRHAGKLNTGRLSLSTLENLAMLDPSYEGYNKKDGSRYRVSAKRAITDLSRDKPVDLEQIDGAYLLKNGKSTAVRATRGRFDQKLGTLTLKDGINLEAPNGMRLVMNSATLNTKNASLVSSEPVLVEMPTAKVRSNAMRIDQRQRSIVFDQGVAAELRPDSGKAGTKVRAADAKTSAGSNAILAFGSSPNSPVNITSGSLTITEKKRTAVFLGNVRATQDGRTLEAPKLVVAFTGGATAFGALGNDPIKDGPGGRLRQIVARDGVRMTLDNNRITAATAILTPRQRRLS